MQKTAGVPTEAKNWPPFFPIIHHDISNEIPIHAQRLQYLAFASWLGMGNFHFCLFVQCKWHSSCSFRIVLLVHQRVLFQPFYDANEDKDGTPIKTGSTIAMLRSNLQLSAKLFLRLLSHRL